MYVKGRELLAEVQQQIEETSRAFVFAMRSNTTPEHYKDKLMNRRARLRALRKFLIDNVDVNGDYLP